MDVFSILTEEQKLELIKNRQHLDVFMHDESWKIRMAVAHQGYGLETLIYKSKTPEKILRGLSYI